MSEVPLTTLLSWAWIAYTIEVDNAVEVAGSQRVGRLFRISLPMWANGLRIIEDGGVTIEELRRRARAACNLGGLERWGWITVGGEGDPRRDGFGTRRGLRPDTVVRPTRAGAYAQKLWPRMLAAVDRRWEERFGGLLRPVRLYLGELAQDMPWSPPEVHPSDGFVTRVVEGAAGTDDGALSVGLLLGQALTALTIDHDRNATVSLPLAANLLRVVDTDTVPSRELPARTGLSREGVAMAVAYLRRHGFASSQPTSTVQLTAQGAAALAQYRDHGPDRHVELRGALESLLAEGDALSDGLAPPKGCWRARKPYVTQTRRLVADPLGALPWHPMVLHRGGWPDAS